MRLGPNLKSPLLNVDNEVVEDNKGKAQALRRKLLQRFLADDDLSYNPMQEHTAPKRNLP